MIPDAHLNFIGLDGRTWVGNSCADVTCFPNVLLRANLAADEIDAVVGASRRVA